MDETRRLSATARRIGHLSLRVTDGPETGKEFFFEYGRQARLPGGRAGGAEGITLADDSVSERHFELVWSGDGLLLRDLESRNGTWVGNVKVREVWLDAGCRFRVGDTEILVQRAEQVDVPLWPESQFHGMTGHSVPMRELFHRLDQVARRDVRRVSVLLLGETGVGKELAARALHTASPRASGPFVAVNCAAIPGELADALLFGHAKGSFTGAGEMRPGYFEAAQGGTLFLDEIGDLPQALQPKLLRVLAEHEIQRVGEHKTIPLDVRVIAATRRDLPQMIAEGRFGEDLYYRLRDIPLRIPSLREHREDIPLLAVKFLDDVSRQVGESMKFTPRALRHLEEAPWPGNVRQLQQVIIRTAIFARDEILDYEHLAMDEDCTAIRRFRSGNVKQILARVERWLFAQILQEHDGRAEQAVAAGMTTEGLRTALRRLGIELDDAERWASAFLKESSCPMCGRNM